MALPTFEYDRRIDIVDALNELSTAADAAIETGGGSSSYVLPVAADAVLGGVKGQRVEENDGSTIDFNSSGALTALGGGGGGASIVRAVLNSNAEVRIGNWVLSTTTPGFQVYGVAQDKWLYILSLQLLSSIKSVDVKVKYSASGTTYLNGLNVKDMGNKIVGAMGTISSNSEPFVREFNAYYEAGSKNTVINIPSYSGGSYPSGISMALNLIFTQV